MKINWKKTIQNKFSHLLTLLVVLFLISPFLEENNIGTAIFSFMFLMAIILTLRTMPLKRKTFAASSLLAGLAFLLDITLCIGLFPTLKEKIAMLTLSVYIIFTAIVITLLAKRMFAIKKVTSDTIKGGVCIYLLIGFLWALLYYFIYAFDKNAFGGVIESIPKKIFYYSFTTLTTVGYGDIYPVNIFASVLSSLEAITGQIFLAVLIARLVGLYIVHELRKDISK